MTTDVTSPLAPASAAPPADWTGTARVPMDVDTAFNGFLAASVANAFDRIGLFDALGAGRPVSLTGFCARVGARPEMVGALTRAAESFGWLSVAEDSAALTALGAEVLAMRGYFTWSVGGYADVFSRAGQIAGGQAAFGADVRRDEGKVALGSGQNDSSFLAPILDEAMSEIDFHTVADLGSGAGGRLCRIVSAREGSHGLGVDISAQATELAERTIGERGLAGRVRAVQADALDSGRACAPADLAAVDTAMSFFLLHDLLADPRSRPSALPRLREAFPAARTFVLADTMLSPAPKETGADTLPVFTAGYELAHALMGIPLHTRGVYEDLFARAGLSVRSVRPFGTPHSWLYVLDAD